jgi:hypothetical protein
MVRAAKPVPASCHVAVPWDGTIRLPRQRRERQRDGMFKALRNLILYRIIGGRVLLGLALLGLARRVIGGRRSAAARESAYQPSQGASQTRQREPR